MTVSYLAVRQIHIACALLSLTLFCLRAALDARALPWRTERAWRWLRGVPHAVDTLLLAAALTLALRSGHYPLQQAWLTAKVLWLIAYIVLGHLALAPERTPHLRQTCFVLALTVWAQIVATAVRKNPWGLAALG